MKVAIIGAGNMGGAIASLIKSNKKINAEDVTVSDINTSNLENKALTVVSVHNQIRVA